MAEPKRLRDAMEKVSPPLTRQEVLLRDIITMFHTPEWLGSTKDDIFGARDTVLDRGVDTLIQRADPTGILPEVVAACLVGWTPIRGGGLREPSIIRGIIAEAIELGLVTRAEVA